MIIRKTTYIISPTGKIIKILSNSLTNDSIIFLYKSICIHQPLTFMQLLSVDEYCMLFYFSLYIVFFSSVSNKVRLRFFKSLMSLTTSRQLLFSKSLELKRRGLLPKRGARISINIHLLANLKLTYE